MHLDGRQTKSKTYTEGTIPSDGSLYSSMKRRSKRETEAERERDRERKRIR